MTDRKQEPQSEKVKVYKMTDEEKEEQRRSFAHGNVSMANPAVTRELVDAVAQREYGRGKRGRMTDQWEQGYRQAIADALDEKKATAVRQPGIPGGLSAVLDVDTTKVIERWGNAIAAKARAEGREEGWYDGFEAGQKAERFAAIEKKGTDQ